MQLERPKTPLTRFPLPFNSNSRHRRRCSNGGAARPPSRLVLLPSLASRTPPQRPSPFRPSLCAPRVPLDHSFSPWARRRRPWRTRRSPRRLPLRREQPRHGRCSSWSRSRPGGLVEELVCLPLLPLLLPRHRASPSRGGSARPWPSTARRWPGLSAGFR